MQRLDAALAASEEGDANAENAMESALAEVEDLISYCNDILCTGAAWLLVALRRPSFRILTACGIANCLLHSTWLPCL